MEIEVILMRTALKSHCRFNVAAAAYDDRGRLLGVANNQPRLQKKGGSAHAEARVIKKCGPDVASIVLTRFGNSGRKLPIHPCSACRRLLTKLKIKVVIL